jgi:hypothetical protein
MASCLPHRRNQAPSGPRPKPTPSPAQNAHAPTPRPTTPRPISPQTRLRAVIIRNKQTQFQNGQNEANCPSEKALRANRPDFGPAKTNPIKPNLGARFCPISGFKSQISDSKRRAAALSSPVTNKPNFTTAPMTLKGFLERRYVEMCPILTAPKQTQSNPAFRPPPPARPRGRTPAGQVRCHPAPGREAANAIEKGRP